jgi:hypothetical protein
MLGGIAVCFLFHFLSNYPLHNHISLTYPRFIGQTVADSPAIPNRAWEYSIGFSRVGSGIDDVPPARETVKSILELVHVCEWLRGRSEICNYVFEIRLGGLGKAEVPSSGMSKDVDAKVN